MKDEKMDIKITEMGQKTAHNNCGNSCNNQRRVVLEDIGSSCSRRPNSLAYWRDQLGVFMENKFGSCIGIYNRLYA